MQFRWWSLFYFILRCFVFPKCGICALFSPFLAWGVIKCGFIFILPGKVKQFDENFHLKSNISDEKQSKMLSNKNKNVAISKWNAAIANTKPYYFNEHPFSSGNSFVSSFVCFFCFFFFVFIRIFGFALCDSTMSIVDSVVALAIRVCRFTNRTKYTLIYHRL